jgi:hypothetical protein
VNALLLATALVTLAAVVWRLVARARRGPGAAPSPARAARGVLLHAVYAPRARRPPARGCGRGVLVFDGLELERVELDELPYPLAGLTTQAARGLYDVPCGRHRVRVRAARDEAPCALDVVMPAGGTLAVSLSAERGLIARSARRAEIDASYIHYPTWARGPLLDRRARPVVDVTGLAEDLAGAFSAAERSACARVADRLVGLALTEAELDALRRVCAEQVARAPAGERHEARARAALLLPEVDATLLKRV